MGEAGRQAGRSWTSPPPRMWTGERQRAPEREEREEERMVPRRRGVRLRNGCISSPRPPSWHPQRRGRGGGFSFVLSFFPLSFLSFLCPFFLSFVISLVLSIEIGTGQGGEQGVTTSRKDSFFFVYSLLACDLARSRHSPFRRHVASSALFQRWHPPSHIRSQVPPTPLIRQEAERTVESVYIALSRTSRIVRWFLPWQ